MSEQEQAVPPEPIPSEPAPLQRAAPDLDRVETVLGHVLRWGVVVSAVLVAAGLVMSVSRHPEYVHDPRQLAGLTEPGADGQSTFPHTLPALWDELLALRGRAVVTLGLVVLVLTPVLRVVTSVIAFAAERDRWFTLITLGVLGVLVLSFVLGRVE